jgi:predicted secreted Zn-dependent protease
MISLHHASFHGLFPRRQWARLVVPFVVFFPVLALAQSTFKWQTNYYAITGSTVREIRRSINQSRPWRNKSETDASTAWQIKWEANVASPSGQCQCTSFTTETTITITLPRWIGLTNAPVGVRQEWRRYITALEDHEIGHAQFALSAAADMHRGIAGVGTEPDCADLRRTINSLARGIADDYRNREKQYDERTSHGARQGALLR